MTPRRAEGPTGRGRALPPLLALLALLALAVPAAAEAKARYRVSGGGYGHGVGLSQWGAYGFAKHGRDYREIATHYFKGSKIAKVKATRSVKVLLATTSGGVSFSNARRACGHDLKPSATYRAVLGGGGVRLQSSAGKRLAGCGKTMDARPGKNRTIQIGGQGAYRGDLLASAAGGTLYVINRVGIDAYVRGVIANEMPSAWPLAALEAQAVAARSYALATDAGSIFDQYDDSRSQTYGGLATETKRTNRAVRKSGRRVLTYNGEVIPGFYFSTSGGRTENVEYAFPGGTPKPYLKSVKDPYDDASPYHRWRLTFSRGEMQAKLGSLVKGRFQGIKVIKRGVSPRIVKAKVLGSGGATTVTGTDIQGRLGLRSTWAKFKKLG